MNEKTTSKKRIILFIIPLMLVLLAVGAWFLYLSPWLGAECHLQTDAVFTLRQSDNGAITVSWPRSEDVDRYTFEVRRPFTAQEAAAVDEKDKDALRYELLHTVTTEDGECVLPAGLPTDMALTLNLSAEKDYKWPFMKMRSRQCEEPIERYTDLEAPEAAELAIEPDSETKTARISWKAKDGNVCSLYVQENGQWKSLGTLEQTDSAIISFGEGKDLPMPGYDETVYFSVDMHRKGSGIEFYGRRSQSLELIRDDLLGTVLELDYTEDGHNVYTLSWNETKGDRYELQIKDENGRWQTIEEFGLTDELSYTTGHLAPFEEFAYRVTAKGKVSLPGSEYSATPSEISFRSWENPIYATIWPLKELDVYSDPARANVIGSVAPASAFCVLDESEGLFKIRYENGEGYIDSNYCLINLPEYMGDLCGYEIKNSYSAIYMVHEFEIPQVTDTIVAGYENIQLNDESFMVPLLYPVAQRLISAAEIAQAEGYRLKIYDAFRPNMATRSIYDLTVAIIDNPLPAQPFDEELTLPELRLPAPLSSLSYRSMLTKGSWTLSNFLASSGSNHNLGIALDLTIEELDTGEELEMQTSMHDLSWYSVINENNSNAIVLDRIMKGAGFGGLTSEWWHFQDNDAKANLKLNTYMWSGVTPECWMKDDIGWRYRLLDGSYLANTTQTIQGVTYTFDGNGYMK